MLYFYNLLADSYFDELGKEVIIEYRQGKDDPSKEFNKIEKSRGAIRKLIKSLKIKSRKS